jgi:hypothetical protein
MERWQRWIYLVAVLLFIAAVTSWTVLGIFALAGVTVAYVGLVRWERRRREARWFITEMMRNAEWFITALWILGLTEWVALAAIEAL